MVTERAEVGCKVSLMHMQESTTRRAETRRDVCIIPNSSVHTQFPNNNKARGGGGRRRLMLAGGDKS